MSESAMRGAAQADERGSKDRAANSAPLAAGSATGHRRPLMGDSSEDCYRCGRTCAIWFAQSPLWNAVIRGGSIAGDPEFHDMVCASCFMELAEERGIATRFRVIAEEVTVELETVTPSGRVWDETRFLWVEATPTTNRAQAREFIATARALLREAARQVDGDLPTIRENVATALTTTTDCLDAIQSAVEDDLREWALDHNELGKDPE